MRKKNINHIADLVRGCDRETILRVVGHCDGHTIFKPELFTKEGLPAEVVEHFTRSYKSDGSPKGTIFVNGEPVNDLRGVYGLDLLRFIASALNVEYRSAMGRGFEAQNIRVALHAHFSRTNPDSTPDSTPVSDPDTRTGAGTTAGTSTGTGPGNT